MKPGGEKKFKFIWRHFEHEDVVNIRIKKISTSFYEVCDIIEHNGE